MVVEMFACPMSSFTVARSTPESKTSRHNPRVGIMAEVVEPAVRNSGSSHRSVERGFDRLDR